MELLISIDDTDNVDSRGTGDVAELLAAGLEEARLARCGRVTRHQLLVHPDIAYTSHNSAMCFPAEIASGDLGVVTSLCEAALREESAEGSDPGLCIVALERLTRPAELVRYGRAAKSRVIAKVEAYQTAAGLGVHLSEHGGSGIGVIGALAGAGLRLSGDDGRYKGKVAIAGDADGVARVAAIRCSGVDEVRTPDGTVLGDEERVLAGEECKLVLLGGRAVLLVQPAPPDAAAPWAVIERKALRSY